MSNLTSFTIRYRRTYQPEAYGAEEAVLEGGFTAEGMDFEAAAYDMVTRARVQAHRALGLPEPAIEPFMPAFGPVGVVYNPDGSVAHDAVALESAPAEKPKRKRRTNAEMKAARAAEEAQKISQEATQAATAVAVATPEAQLFEEPVKQAELDLTFEEPVKQAVTAAGLQALCTKVAQQLKDGGPIKALLAEFNVGRISELSDADRVAFAAKVEALV